MKHGMQIRLGPGQTVLDGDPAPPPLKGQSPQFLAHICCGQMAGWIKMPLDTEVGLSPGDFVLDGWGPSSPSPKRGRSPPPQFLAHVYSGQTAGWIKMALGMKVGLGPGDIVLDGDPAPPSKKGAQQPPPAIFIPCLMWPSSYMCQDTTWYGRRPQSRRHCVRLVSSSPFPKGAQPPHTQFSLNVRCGLMAGEL